jgi:hypothetical protein
MLFNLELPNNIIAILFSVLSWSLVIALVIYRFFKQQQKKPTLWKALLISLIGVFSFTINLDLFDTMVKIPVLPLGVWMVYGYLRKKSWGTYRIYAWIGFMANFIFLVTTVISTPVHNGIYPKAEVSTYIANVDDAAIVQIHPSASEAAFHKEQFEMQLDKLQLSVVQSDQWYLNAKLESSSSYHKERFPYQLTGTEPRWGSGIQTVIYIEDSGRGILITTSKHQVYYTSSEPLLEMGGHSDEQ